MSYFEKYYVCVIDIYKELSDLPASRARFSTAPDRPMFSLPAKSTRFNFPILNLRMK